MIAGAKDDFLSPASLRRLVSGIGLIVAVVTTVSVPVGYATLAYVYEANALEFKAKLNAGRIARYIYGHERMWQYQRIRLVELIEFESNTQPVRQRVLDLKGKLVLEEGAVDGPHVLARSAPILVAGTPVGRLEIETSLEPMMRNALWVALFSSLLGFAAYFAVRLLPLRVLDRTLGALQDKNMRFDAALTNMSQGLSMFDAQARLVVSNERFAELYGLPPELARPGTAVAELLAYRKAGQDKPEFSEELVADIQAVIARKEPATITFETTEGRIVSVFHKPMSDGGFVSTHEDITERRRSEAEIARMARHDALTDLPNRVLLREHIDEALVGVKRRGDHAAVLCIDLDRFKAVNDTLGHPAGDELLRQVGQRLRACVRDGDTVARLGGDEFAILQRSSDQPRDATALARRIVEEVSTPYQIYGNQVVVGASVGVAIAPGDGVDPDVLFKNADLALYRAKAERRGSYRFFEAEMDFQAQARRSLELDLRNALGNGELALYYQPLVSLSSDRVSGFEALMRWQHPVRGFVSPADFIPVAEEIGLIASLGEWVIRQACADASAWPEDVKIAVNLSPAQFVAGNNLPHVVMNALAASQLRPGRLELEITETVLLDESETTLSTLHRLRSLGVHISPDDFGTGYSSLSYLRKFPFDKIKIDRSFVRELASRGECHAIVHAVVGLATALGMETTAEGVETQDQLEELRLEGCTEAQGFLFSPARPVAEAKQLIESCGNRVRAAA